MLTPTDEAWRLVLKKLCSRTDFPKNLQRWHTPLALVNEMLTKLAAVVNLQGKNILTINMEYVEILIYEFGIQPNKITFVIDCPQKAKIIKEHSRYKGVRVFECNYLSVEKIEDNNVKFDIICGNPPYQTKSDESNRKTQPLWDEFVKKSFNLLKEDGYLCFVHPNGWRDVKGVFEDTKALILSKEVQYLEMHDMNDGVKTFDVQTNYDWYIAKNTPSKGNKTHIKGQDGSEYDVDISTLDFIPSRKFDEIFSLIAKPNEDKVEILHSFSSYETRQDWMSETKTDKFKYPCIYSIKMGDVPTLWYSSTNKKGHFGIPKFIWGNGVCTSIGSIVDADGEYGLTQFGYAIVDKKETLPHIKKAFDSPKFKELMKACPNQNNNINRKVIALFRKDFWKQFIK